MKLEVGNNQGYVIVDDNTGEILDVFVELGKKTFDNRIINSYHRIGNKHYRYEQ